jgi:hypothetical protein
VKEGVVSRAAIANLLQLVGAILAVVGVVLSLEVDPFYVFLAGLGAVAVGVAVEG